MALFDAFLKLDGIKGESQDPQHKDEIDVLSFSWGEEQTAGSPTSGGSGAGKVKFHDFSITKKTDASSPLLMLHCANGAHIKEANFVVRKAGGAKVEYLKINLTDVLVTSYRSETSDVNTATTGGAPAGGELPSDKVTLSFAKVEVSYQPQGPDGKAQGGPIVAGWDVKANKEV
jgi:type VI secretion system secreted protein Hcp